MLYAFTMQKRPPKGYVPSETAIARAAKPNYRGVSALMFIFIDLTALFSATVFFLWAGVPLPGAVVIGVVLFAGFFVVFDRVHKRFGRRAIEITQVRE